MPPNGNVARTNAPDRVVLSLALNQDPRTGVHSRPVRVCTLKRSHHRSSSGSEDDEPSAKIAANGGVHSHQLVALNQVPLARDPRLCRTARMQSHSTDSEDDAAANGTVEEYVPTRY